MVTQAIVPFVRRAAPVIAGAATNALAQATKSLPNALFSQGANGAKPLQQAAELALSTLGTKLLQSAGHNALQARGNAATEGATGRNPAMPLYRGLSSPPSWEKLVMSPEVQQLIRAGMGAAIGSRLGPGAANSIPPGAAQAFTGAMEMMATLQAMNDSVARNASSPRPGSPTQNAAARARQQAQQNAASAQSLQARREASEGSGTRNASSASNAAAASSADGVLAASDRTPTGRLAPEDERAIVPWSDPAAQRGSNDGADAPEERRPQRTPPDGPPPNKNADSSDPFADMRPDPQPDANWPPPPTTDKAEFEKPMSDQDIFDRHEVSMNKMLERQLQMELDQMRRQMMMDNLKNMGNLFRTASEISN